MDALILIVAALFGLSVLAHLFGIAVVAARFRRPARQGGPATALAGVSVIRPVCGTDNYLAETLESSFHLDHGPYEVLFCAADPLDPALVVVRRLIARHPHVDARILTGDDRVSANPKLNNIVKGWRAARYQWVVMADHNVAMPVDYLSRLQATWTEGTGLVCSPPVGSRPEGVAAEIECAVLNTYQARWQLFADALGFGFAQGKTMLWRRDLLDAAGGVEALGCELAEDAAATKLVRAAGLRVRLVDRPFEQPLGRRRLVDVWNRQLRWARLRRDTFGLWFLAEPLSGVLLPLGTGSLLADLAGLPVAPVAVGTLAVWYGAEAVLARTAGWHLTWRAPLLWLARDLALPALWTASWLGNGFTWRGNAMRLAEERTA